MKILRYLMLSVLLLGVSNIAHAFSWTLQDPPSTDSPFFTLSPGQRRSRSASRPAMYL